MRDHTMRFPGISSGIKDFELVFNHIPIGINYLTRDFVIINMNPYLLEKLGVKLENVRGRYCYEVRAEILGDEKKGLKRCSDCKAQAAMETGEIQHFVKELIPDFIVENTMVPVKNETGEIIGIIELLQDISEKILVDSELHASEEKYKSVVDNIGIGVALISPSMEIMAMNKQMHKWFPLIDVSKKPICFRWFNNPPQSKICSYCPTIKTLQDGQVHESLTDTPLVNEIKNYRIISSPILNSEGKVTAAIEMVEDITERTRAERKIQEYQNNLEALVTERTERLSIANLALQKEIAERKQAEKALQISSNKIEHFAYSISHDLKTPAISICGLTRLLNKHYEGALDQKGKNYCQQILRSSEQIADLVEMINLYISTKEIPLKIEEINLAQLLFILREEFAGPIKSRQIRWTEPKHQPEIKADSVAILRVLRNFVDNSLKYGGNDLSEIAVGYREDGEYHILYVSDDGIGLKEEDPKAIFGVFKRHKTSCGIPGSGLGLAIAKEIAELHKGKVWFEPGSKKGITFNISISKNI